MENLWYNYQIFLSVTTALPSRFLIFHLQRKQVKQWLTKAAKAPHQGPVCPPSSRGEAEGRGSGSLKEPVAVIVELLRCVQLFYDPMDCSPPGSSVHGISQARMLEWVAIPFSKGSSWSKDWTHSSCIHRQILYHLSHQGSPKAPCTFPLNFLFWGWS